MGQPVGIWTICAGNPPDGPLSPFAELLHTRWQTRRDAAQQRRQEDIASCSLLSAGYLHFPIPDCIYRRSRLEAWHEDDKSAAGVPPVEELFLYASEQALFDPVHPAEATLVHKLRTGLASALPEGAQVVCPLALGGHVDHSLTRQAAQELGRPLWFYADYPYVARLPDYADNLLREGWQPVLHPVSPAGLEAWQQAVAAHESQISSFWPSLEEMYSALRDYLESQGGILLWQAPLRG